MFFTIAVACLEAILKELSEPSADTQRLQGKLQKAKHQELFINPNEPFSDGQVFSGSFFNLFHYNHGCLNAHRDRYLITVIAMQPPFDTKGHSCLWIKSPKGKWINIDAEIQRDEVVIIAGEELSQLGKSIGRFIPASEHCIRVNPEGRRIPNAHFQRDPETPPVGNRCSMALILGEHT